MSEAAFAKGFGGPSKLAETGDIRVFSRITRMLRRLWAGYG
jgi:hypothetical protein